ncbi:hypothetical protein [Actinopolyspora erythraea]|uniref:hypothetical protein n=1 Tax=Actinopolyspora erythraea TaxID=414996 RepID=UPI0011855D4D|nr:hypothetical protein [Actinopolyspora erythraea]
MQWWGTSEARGFPPLHPYREQKYSWRIKMIPLGSPTVKVTLTIYTNIESCEIVLNHCSTVTHRLVSTILDLYRTKSGHTVIITVHNGYDPYLESPQESLIRTLRKTLESIDLPQPELNIFPETRQSDPLFFKNSNIPHDSVVKFADSCKVTANIDTLPYDLSPDDEYNEDIEPVKTPEYLPVQPHTLYVLHLITKGLNGTGAGVVARSFIDWFREFDWVDNDEINIEQPNYIDSKTLNTKVFLTQWHSSPEAVLKRIRESFPIGHWGSVKKIEGKEARAKYTYNVISTYHLSTTWYRHPPSRKTP